MDFGPRERESESDGEGEGEWEKQVSLHGQVEEGRRKQSPIRRKEQGLTNFTEFLQLEEIFGHHC